MRAAERRRRSVRAAAVALALALAVLAAVPPLAAYPILPVEAARGFLPSLSAAPIAPGDSGALGFELVDPLPEPISNVTLTFALYAFDPFPGPGSSPVPSNSPVLSAGGTAAGSVTLDAGSLAPEGRWSTPLVISVPGAAPAGTYSIRDAIRFELNGTGYLLESIGNFPASLWRNATVLPNGTPTLNLSRLGVSGVLPETAVLVRSTAPLDDAIYALGGAAVVLAGAGGYLALRGRGPSSRSGARPPPKLNQAARALGKS